MRIADFLNEKLKSMGITNHEAGAVIYLDTGEQCSIAGALILKVLVLNCFYVFCKID